MVLPATFSFDSILSRSFVLPNQMKTFKQSNSRYEGFLNSKSIGTYRFSTFRFFQTFFASPFECH